MSTRLKNWLDSLVRYEQRLLTLPPYQQYGRLVRATGLVMEVVGLKLSIGTLCLIERKRLSGTDFVEGEVVGFNTHLLYIMPCCRMHGFLPSPKPV